MKKLLTILLVILLLCGCGAREETSEPEEILQESSQSSELSEESEEPAPEEKLLQISVFEENGKFGIKNAAGEVIEPAEYEFYEEYWEGICLYNSAGTDMLPLWNEKLQDYEMAEQEVFDREVFMFDGAKMPGGPYREVETREIDAELCLAMGDTKNGHRSFEYSNGVFTESSSFSDQDPEKVIFGYEIFQNGLRGLRAPDGSELIPPYNYNIEIPFEDRAICRRGPYAWLAVDCERDFIYELPSGKIINQSYNYIDFRIFDEGYIFIAYAGGEILPEVKALLPDGSVLPRGYWFIDKNGDPISERYEKIYFEGERYFLWELDSLDAKVFAEKEDGSLEEFILRDLLIKE